MTIQLNLISTNKHILYRFAQKIVCTSGYRMQTNVRLSILYTLATCDFALFAHATCQKFNRQFFK